MSSMYYERAGLERRFDPAINEVVAAGNVALVCVSPLLCSFTAALLGYSEELVSAHPSLDAAEAAKLRYDYDEDCDGELRYELRYDSKAPSHSRHVLYHPTRARKTCFELGCDETVVHELVWNSSDGDWDDIDYTSMSREAARNRYRQLLANGWLSWDWDRMRRLSYRGRYLFCSMNRMDDPDGAWLKRFREAAEKAGAMVVAEAGHVWVEFPEEAS